MDAYNTPIKVGDVVQIDPTKDPIFGGHFLIVMELRPDGCEGVCALPGENGQPRTAAIIRLGCDDMRRVGPAPWAAAHGTPR